MHKLQVVTPPAKEPLTLEEAKDQLRVDFIDDDTIIMACVKAAREIGEKTTRRAFITQTMNLFLDAFPGDTRIEIPLPPLQSVTGIYYTPDGGAETEFDSSNYEVDTVSEPGGVVLVSSASWPADTLKVVNGVRIEFVAGYGDEPEDIPETYRSGIRLALGHLYENRENVVVGIGVTITELPQGAQYLFGFDRMFKFR